MPTDQHHVKMLDIHTEYHTEILGLGEIYEILSVERLRNRLKRKYGNGVLFLSSNKDHSGRGMNIDELINYVKQMGFDALEFGYVDAPPWRSKRRAKPRKMVNKSLVLTLAKIILKPLVYLEPFIISKHKAHMLYVFSRNG